MPGKSCTARIGGSDFPNFDGFIKKQGCSAYTASFIVAA